MPLCLQIIFCVFVFANYLIGLFERNYLQKHVFLRRAVLFDLDGSARPGRKGGSFY